MKTITSVTVFNDAVGLRLSASYAEVEEDTGRITADNKRFDRVVTDPEARAAAEDLFRHAFELLDGAEREA